MPQLFGDVHFGKGVVIGETAVIGKPFRPLLDGTVVRDGRRTIIANETYVGDFCVIGQGTIIGSNCRVDDYIKIECDVTIGRGCILMNRTLIQNDVTVGDECVLGALIGDFSTISGRCRIFGSLVHIHRDPGVPWDADTSMEGGPRFAMTFS